MLSKNEMQELLGIFGQSSREYVEIFIENSEKNNLCRKNKEDVVCQKRIQGLGIRILKGNQEFYTSTSDLSRDGLLKCAENFKDFVIAKQNEKKQSFSFQEKRREYYKINSIPWSSMLSNKRKSMEQIEKAAYDVPNIKQAEVLCSDIKQNVVIANNEGVYVEDERSRSRVIVSTTAIGKEKQQNYSSVNGLNGTWSCFENVDAEFIGRKCALDTIEILKADICPTGRFPVIISGGLGGTLFHEACGHSLEATFVANGNSEFAGQVGKKVASSIVTLIDDGTLAGGWGTGNIDDEGIPCKKNILIENGILKGYLVDRLNSKIMGMLPTGNGRRESYMFAPTSRMTNTYILPGKETETEIIKNTDYGIYATEFSGGSVNPLSGEFNFGIIKGYLIKNGKIDRPIHGGSVIGKGSEILQKVDKVGNSLKMGQCMCGSTSGVIPVGLGQPIIRICEMTVGGN